MASRSVRAIQLATSWAVADLRWMVEQGRLIEAHMDGCKRCRHGKRCQVRQAMAGIQRVHPRPLS